MIAVCSPEYPKNGNMTILNVDMCMDQNSGKKINKFDRRENIDLYY